LIFETLQIISPFSFENFTALFIKFTKIWIILSLSLLIIVFISHSYTSNLN
jgi:hypothetical protein